MTDDTNPPPVATPRRFSARPPAKFTSSTDFNLWIQRFELYVDEAGIPPEKRAREILSLLEDEPFRVVSQLGLILTDDYDAIKKELQQQFSPCGTEPEWQFKLQSRRQQPGETLAEFAGQLRMLTDRAYPDWEPKQRLEMARNQFIQGVQSSKTQLELMKEKPRTLERALQAAQAMEAVEVAQKRMRNHAASLSANALEEHEVNALRTPFRSPAESQIQELSLQVKQLTETVARLTALQEGGVGRQLPRRNQRIQGPVCWTCHQRGHVRRNCPQQQRAQPQERLQRPRGNAAVESALAVQGMVEQRPTRMLVDTGSAVTILREDVWKEAGSPPMTSLHRPVVAANGEELSLLGQTQVTIALGEFNAVHSALIVKELTQECLLGADFLVDQGCVVNLQTMRLSVGQQSIALQTEESNHCNCCVFLTETTHVPARHQQQLRVHLSPPANTTLPLKQVGMLVPEPKFLEKHSVLAAHSLSTIDRSRQSVVCILNPNPLPATFHKGEKIGQLQILEPLEVLALQPGSKTVATSSNPTGKEKSAAIQQIESGIEGLTMSQYDQLHRFLQNHIDVISTRPGDLGRTGILKHRINTGDSPPVRQPLRRLPYHKRGEVDKMLDDMLSQGVIEPASGPWSSPIVLVTKKDGTSRFCVDFRKVNNLTVKDAHPLPRIDDTLDTLSGSRWFSTLDLTSGYWQVEVEAADKEKTAFCTHRGLFQFKVMPFGLANAPSTFQRLMELTLSDLHWETCLVYLDDIIIFSKTVEEHLCRLREVFRRLREAGLKIKPSKCHLLRKSVKYLGHVVSAQGVETDAEKTQAVTTWPAPCNLKDLRQFLGFCSYYRRFVRNFAQIAAPLYTLTEKNKEWAWTEQCDIAFHELKHKLTSSPVLAFPDFSQDFILDCDASGDGLGAVLSQRSNNLERPVAYASRRLTKSERRYCATRREMLALVWAVNNFRPYLLGRPFLARTDHHALKWLHSFKEPEGQVARWLEMLSAFDFTVCHRSGREHINADALSRRPCPQCGMNGPDKQLEEQTTCTTEVAMIESTNWMPTVQLQQHQQSDPDLSQMITWLKTDTLPSSFPREVSRRLQTLWSQRQQLILQNDVLYRQWEDVPHGGAHKRLQVILPKSLVHSALQELHDATTGGHLGVKKTLQKAQQRFYWTGQRRDVEEWCRCCPLCTSRKSPSKTPRAQMQIEQTGNPVQRVAMDILGPLPRTNAGNRYILIIGDYFTKWTEAFPMANMEAQTVARIFVDEFVCRFGAPQYLHTDQGRNFESHLLKEICKLLGIKKTRTTPYHPQSDGMIERFNRTLLTMLSLTASENDNSWDVNLPMLMMAYRSSEHETTKASPHSLMFGRELRLPIDLMLGLPETESSPNTSHYALKLRERLENAYHQTRQHIQQQQHRQKELYDRRACGNPYRSDDLVWLHQPAVPRGKAHKFHRPWKGPFRIVKVLSDSHYRIVNTDSPHQRLIVHFDRLKPYKGRPLSGTSTDSRISPSAGPLVSPPPSVSETESSHDTSSETLSTENDSESQGTSSAEEDSETQGTLSAEEDSAQSHGTSSTEEDSDSQDSNLSEEATSVPIPPHQPIPPTITVRRSTRIRKQRDFGPFITH